ncbi:thioester domain-containing protein [Spirillospora sp. NPDC052269]
MNGLSRRSGCVIAAALVFLSLCVSPASAGVDPRHWDLGPRARADLPPTAEFSLIALGPGGEITGYVGPDTVDPLNGYPSSGYDTTGFDRFDLPYAGIIQGAKADGTRVRTYCLDLEHEVWGRMAYRYGTWSETQVVNLGYISRAIHDFYPNTDEPAGLTDEEKATAVQAAIWFFSDRYVLADTDPMFSVTSAIVARVLQEGPLPEPPPPSLTISGPDSVHAGVVSGPFRVETTAPRAVVTITGGEMFADAAGTRPIPSGTELAAGEAFYVRSPEPGQLRLSASATAAHQVGNAAVYVRDAAGQPDFPEQGQKIILAQDDPVDLTADKDVEVTEAPPVPPVPPVHRPSISVEKRVRPGAYHRPGQVLHFRVKVTNTGDVALNDVRVDDGLSRVRCPRTTLAPGRSMYCTATYRVTRRDLRRRSVRNCAVAMARPPESEGTVKSRRACVRAYGHVPVTG